jgi:hypothetical protein
LLWSLCSLASTSLPPATLQVCISIILYMYSSCQRSLISYSILFLGN